MSSRSWALVVLGVLLILAGTVFMLQGANVIKGSSLMSGDPTYIYVGAVVIFVGFLIGVAGALLAGRGTPKRD